MPLGLKLVDLPLEILTKIFDYLYYDNQPFYSCAEVLCDEYIAGWQYFPPIIRAIPQFKPVCMRYFHKQHRDAIDVVLSYYLLQEPAMRSAVKILDLSAYGIRMKPPQVQSFLNQIGAAEHLDEGFNRKEMYHWLRLALRLLPGINNLIICERNMFGKRSSIHHLLTNHMDAFRNLRHIRMETAEGRRKVDLAFLISRLLDLPHIQSISLIGFKHIIAERRRVLLADSERPEGLESSRCLYFSFQETFLTRDEISIISARCKPQVLNYTLSPSSLNCNNKTEGDALHRGFLEALVASPRFAHNLQCLDISGNYGSWMWTTHSTNFASFPKLVHLHLPIEALVNNLSHLETPISKLLPPSLKILSLRTNDIMDEHSPMDRQLMAGDCLDRVVEILRNKRHRYPNLVRLDVDVEFLATGDIVRREIGQVGRLAEAFRLARANGVKFGDTELRPGQNMLYDMRQNGKALEIIVDQGFIQAELRTDRYL